MSKNKNLHAAKKAKNDEFYTQYEDIKKEVERYADQLKDKIIYCNCDNEESNFYKYFQDNFDILGLKKLIYFNGDFRSEESIEMLKQCDIVITNPMFSLFRIYITQLMEYDKKFLILGNNNAITYKEVFKYIKENKLWLGYTSNKTMSFQLDDSYDKWNYIKDDKKFGNVPAISWFTNLDNKKRHIDLIRNVLYKKYNEVDYPKYDNYDAININKVADIPVDYFGYMGVPITYLSNHNPEQFEIIGLGISKSGIEIGVKPYKPEHKKYRKEIQKRGAVDGDLYMITNGIVDVPYARIVIKRK